MGKIAGKVVWEMSLTVLGSVLGPEEYAWGKSDCCHAGMRHRRRYLLREWVRVGEVRTSCKQLV